MGEIVFPLCPQGHEYRPENTYTDKRGARHCKTCRRERMAARRAEQPKKGQGWQNAAKTHCPKGHEYSAENTARNRDGKRRCLTCARANSRVQNVKRYGITGQLIAEMFEAQDRRCDICRKEFGHDLKPHIDHDHACCPGGGSCGKCIRALLCAPCNHGLGKFLDSPELLRAAALYLERHRGSITS